MAGERAGVRRLLVRVLLDCYRLAALECPTWHEADPRSAEPLAEHRGPVARPARPADLDVPSADSAIR
jgi:hypothetical protein